MLLDRITEFIKTYPNLENFNNIIKNKTNYSGVDKDFYLIKEDVYNPLVKEYSNGTSVRQFQFIFCSKDPYDPIVIESIQNSGFFEEFINWIEVQNENVNLPILGNNNESLEIKVLTNGHSYRPNVNQDLELYKIVFRLKYFKGV